MKPDCQACPLCAMQRKQLGSSIVDPNAPTVIVECPGKQEELLEQPFSGMSGRRVLASLKYQRIYTVNKIHAISCRAPRNFNEKDWGQAIRCCRPRLLADLQRLSIHKYLLIGKHAVQAVYRNIMSLHPWLGSCIDFSIIDSTLQASAVITLPPAACYQGKPQYFPVFDKHVETFKDRVVIDKPYQWGSLVYFKSGEDYQSDTLKTLEIISHAKSGTFVGLDIETAGIDPMHSELTALGLAIPGHAVSILYPLDRHFAGNKARIKPAEKLIKQILRNSKLYKVAHNGTHDLLGLKAKGYPVRGYKHDTILLHHTIANTLRHDLGFVAQTTLGCDPWKALFRITDDAKGGKKFEKAWKDYPTELTEYNAKDTAILPPLAKQLLADLKGIHNGSKIYKGYLERSLIASTMRHNGAFISRANVDKHAKALQREKKKTLKAFDKAVIAVGCEPCLPGSIPKLQHLFFEHLKLSPQYWSPITHKPSLPAKYLRSLMFQPDTRIKNIVKSLLSYRKASKLYSTYIRRIVESDSDYLYAVPKVWGTKSGRWAYSDPNLQNIPPVVRDIIVSRFPNGWILECDYSQLELRIIAYLSQDELMCEWFANGKDLHTETARAFFGSTFDQANDKEKKRLRKLAKGINFGDNYGAGAETVWNTMAENAPGLRIADVDRMLTVRHTIHKGLTQWRKNQVSSAYQNDYVQTPISGRRLHFFGIVEPTKCYNYPIQGGGSDIIDSAIHGVFRDFKRLKNTVLLFQVHDALIVDTTDPLNAARVMKRHMEKPVLINGIKRVFPISFKIGRDWKNGSEFNNLEDLEKFLKEQTEC